MTPTIPLGVPAELIAGETWNWQHQFQDLPISDGWNALTYQFRGVDVIDIATPRVTNDGTLWTVLTLPADTTAKIPGRYEWFARVAAAAGTYAGQQRTAARGVVLLRANPVTAIAGTLQTFNEQMLAQIEQEFKARVPGTGAGHVSLAIDGQNLTKLPIMELHDLRKYYRNLVSMDRRGGQWGPDIAFRI
jgi:hypothetical protein